MPRPILETVGQWSYEVPPGSPLESVEEARRRGERRAPEEQRFAELRPRLKRRETFPAVGRLVFLSASAQPWRDAVVRFLEEPIEEDLAALEARAAEAWRESGGPPARLRFRLPDGRFGDSSDAGGSNGDEPFLAFAEVVAEALAREGRLDLDAEIAAGVTFRDRLTGNRPAPIGDDESTREGDGGTAPSSSDVSILDGFEAVFGTRTPEPSAFGEAPVVWRGHPARVGGAAVWLASRCAGARRAPPRWGTALHRP